MELLIFSDSHGQCEAMSTVYAMQLHSPDAVCFLGDGIRDFETVDFGSARLYAVRGNCDWSSLSDSTPTELLFSALGHTLLLTHGHLHNVKSGLDALCAYAVSKGADIVLFGHTHQPAELVLPVGREVMGTPLSRPLYLFNPGSIGLCEGERSFGTLVLRQDTVLFSNGRI